MSTRDVRSTPGSGPEPSRRVAGDDSSVHEGPGAGRPVAVLEDDADFFELKRRLTRFVFPMTAAFLGWYLLYVLLSAFARDFMGTKVAGNINVALLLGLLQFVSTFAIAWAYSRYATRRLDPLSARLRDRIGGAGA